MLDVGIDLIRLLAHLLIFNSKIKMGNYPQYDKNKGFFASETA